MEFKHFYRRRLPHFQHDGATYFVTSRLHGSLPRDVLSNLTDEHVQANEQIQRSTLPPDEKLERLDHQRRIHFGRFDRCLHQVREGPHHFRVPEIAAAFLEAALFRHQTEFELICLTVMSNHTHLVCTSLRDGHPLHQIMGSLKRRVATFANATLHQHGAFWQDENYDRTVRNSAELARIIGYTVNNPVEAGLVKQWEDWPYTWLNPDFTRSVVGWDVSACTAPVPTQAGYIPPHNEFRRTFAPASFAPA